MEKGGFSPVLTWLRACRTSSICSRTTSSPTLRINQLTELRNAFSSPMSPMFAMPFGSPHTGSNASSIPFGEEGFLGSPFPPQGQGAGVSAGRLRAIKNRVRDSFKKRRNVPGKTHIAKMDALDEDISKIKDYTSKGQIASSLAMLEAITEEFADRVAEVSLPGYC